MEINPYSKIERVYIDLIRVSDESNLNLIVRTLPNLSQPCFYFPQERSIRHCEECIWRDKVDLDEDDSMLLFIGPLYNDDDDEPKIITIA